MPPQAQGRAEADGVWWVQCRTSLGTGPAHTLAPVGGTGQVCLGWRISSGPASVSHWNSVKFTSQIVPKRLLPARMLPVVGGEDTHLLVFCTVQQYLSILEAESSQKKLNLGQGGISFFWCLPGTQMKPFFFCDRKKRGINSSDGWNSNTLQVSFNLGKSKPDLEWNLSNTQISENAFHQSNFPHLSLLLFNAEINKDESKCFWLQEYLRHDSPIRTHFAEK